MNMFVPFYEDSHASRRRMTNKPSQGSKTLMRRKVRRFLLREIQIGSLEVGPYDDRDYTFADVILRRRLDAGLSICKVRGFS